MRAQRRSTSEAFSPQQVQLTIRFIQGYRYLDRCGEALVRLETKLLEGWIPGEASPRSGSIKNDMLGMTVTFNAEAMTVLQAEYIDFEHFRDQACRVYEVLRDTFEINRINIPSLKVVLQRGFPDSKVTEASTWLAGLELCFVRPELMSLLGGKQDALDYTLVTVMERTWNEERVEQKRRLAASVIRQEKQAPFDERLLRRAKLLPERQREAMAALIGLRRKHPDIHPVAAQLDLEHAFETELDSRTFDLYGFLTEAWEWGRHFAEQVVRFDRRA